MLCSATEVAHETAGRRGMHFPTALPAVQLRTCEDQAGIAVHQSKSQHRHGAVGDGRIHRGATAAPLMQEPLHLVLVGLHVVRRKHRLRHKLPARPGCSGCRVLLKPQSASHRRLPPPHARHAMGSRLLGPNRASGPRGVNTGNVEELTFQLTIILLMG